MQTRELTGEIAGAGPDFRHVETWVFDLDNTLYLLGPDRISLAEERICLFVQGHFGIARAQAWEIQKRYLNEYGSTLGGLARHDGVDADAYHDFVNDIDSLNLVHDADLLSALARLPGKRLVFTNNCGRFAAEVLERIGVAALFDDIVDARATGFVPKPQAAAYEALIARDVVAGRAALFDDSARNLKQAHVLGMTTVWLNNGFAQAKLGPLHDATSTAHIHHETPDLAPFLRTLRI